MGYEGDKPAVFDRNANGWITVPAKMKLPKGQQERDMLARELLIKFQNVFKSSLGIFEKDLR